MLALVGTADDTGIEGEEDGRDDVALVELATAEVLLDPTTDCDRIRSARIEAFSNLTY